MTYIIAQIFGGLVSVLVFVSGQVKSMAAALLCQIGCNGFGMLSYVLLGGFSGCGIYLIATAQSALYFYLRKTGKEEPRWLNPIIVAAYILCSAFSFRGLIDVIPMIAAVLCAIGLTQKNPRNYRIVLLLNGAIWIAYDLFVGAYSMLASHIITVVSALSGIIRLDILKKSEKN